MENLSLTDKEKRKEDIKFNLKEYTIKTKTCEEHTIFLPFPGELKELISLNTISNRISLDSNKLVSFFGTNNDIDFLNNDFIHSSIILKAICAFLGSINQENDIADITDDYVSPLEDEQYLENSKNYFSYIEKNKNIIFSSFKLKDFFLLIDALLFIGISIPKEQGNILYQSIKAQAMMRDQIAIIVAPSNNFWIKSEQVNINGINYDKKLNNFSNIFFNVKFVNKFLDKIANHPRCYLGLINSMNHKNLKSTFDSLKTECNKFPSEVALFDQLNHLNIEENPKAKPIFVRSIEGIKGGLKVLKHEEFTDNNILILESEPDKINDTKDNSVSMNLFSEQYLSYSQAEKEKIEQSQDEIIEYILKLLEECTDDIRDYLNNHHLE